MNMHSLTRRTFTKSAVAASASFALDGFSQTVPSQRRVGIAPIGLGSIAEVFMRAVGKSQNAKLTGLVTGHPVEKGKKFAAMYGVADSSIYTPTRPSTIFGTTKILTLFTWLYRIACIANTRSGQLKRASMFSVKSRWLFPPMNANL